MIKSFKHKGLEIYFKTSSLRGIQAKHRQKLGLILDQLHAAHDIQDMNFPGSGLHPLKGNLRGYFAVSISGNWRLIFEFSDGNAFNVDYVDYH